MGVLKHFAPWEHILAPGAYFALRVLKHFEPDFELYQVFMHNFYAKLI